MDLGVKSIEYKERIKNRGKLRFILGLGIRSIKFLKFYLIRIIARCNGAQIGRDVIIPFQLAINANNNLSIGDFSVLESIEIDLRDKVNIGSNVIINKGVQILRASHCLDDQFYSTISYPLIIEDYVWLCTGSKILPRTVKIKYGSVIGAYCVCTLKEVPKLNIIAGNPSKIIRLRKQVPKKLVTPSLKGNDLREYVKTFQL